MAGYTPITNVLDFQKSFNPAGGFPLDARSMFATKTAADAAAATAVIAGSADQSKSKYYIGQILTVFENDAVVHYSIEPNKTLKEVGKSIATDNKTIVMNNEVLSLKDFGVQYYAYNSETGETDTAPTTGWKAGLQPRVIANTDGSGYSIAWFEPSSTTVEGLNDIVSSMQGTVDGLDERIGAVEQSASDNTADIKAEVERATEAEGALSDRITKNTTDIGTLNADAQTEGSVEYKIAQALSALLNNENADLDSLEELVTWAETHAKDALELSNNVAANDAAIDELETLIGALPEGTKAVDVIGYIQEAIKVEVDRAKAEEATLLSKIEALETANTTLGSAAFEAKEAFATAAQGALADTAVQEVTAGDNGHVLVDGADVAVYTAPIAKTNVLGDVMVDGASIGASEAGVISVVAVDSSKVTGLDTKLAATESAATTAANTYTDDTAVAKSNVVDSSNVAESVDDASVEKVVSEELLIDALSWKTEM